MAKLDLAKRNSPSLLFLLRADDREKWYATTSGCLCQAEHLASYTNCDKSSEPLGVGRSALSNFLNGKVSLSADMAIRLQGVFAASLADLFDIQSEFEIFHQRAKDFLSMRWVGIF